MTGTGLSAADIVAMTGSGRNGDNSWQDNPFIYLVWLALLGNWGNGGFGGGFGGGGASGALTRAELYDGFTLNNIDGQIRGVQNGLCDGFYALNTTALQGFNGVGQSLCQGFNSLGTQIAENRFAAQQCCCDTNRNIDAVRYENAKNTCDIITNQNFNTRDIIDSQNSGFQKILDKMCQNEIQQLRSDLQTANFQLSQQAQSANLLNQLRPPIVPTVPAGAYYGWMNGCGCGCGC